MNAAIITGLVGAAVFFSWSVKESVRFWRDERRDAMLKKDLIDYIIRTTPDTRADTTMTARQKYLFDCYLQGNDDWPSIHCPHPEGSIEAREWIAGWQFANRGMRVDGHERRLAARTKREGGDEHPRQS